MTVLLTPNNTISIKNNKSMPNKKEGEECKFCGEQATLYFESAGILWRIGSEADTKEDIFRYSNDGREYTCDKCKDNLF